MKIFMVICACLLALSGCGGSGSDAGAPVSESAIDKDTSYALGMNLGASIAGDMANNGLEPDIAEFLQGFKDSLENGKTRFTAEEAETKIRETFMARMEKENGERRQAEIDFLAENSKKEGITITGSGLQYEVISEGGGVKPAASDTVRVNYEGTLSDGTVFDSSYSRGEPVEFPLDQVIPGWTEGIQLMSEGSNYRFYIPSDLGYGPQGIPPAIPPYSPLIFEVELISILK
ncbi:MAG: FKBP-type peptidyl-prolyl cis-trans isomerase [Treponema sp.]|jgi:FKBP-type peptidyl-prolyl cis-trans isomerase FkpA|nr:FKBP-type peptidyl-prolyl cis-trans isomerase [Treponema sp.]